MADSVIENAELKGLQYSGTEIQFKEITETKFIRCNFSEAIFSQCRFRDCTFTKCNLSMLHVKNSVFYDVHFEGCKAIGINWTEASWQKGGFFHRLNFDDCHVSYSSFFGLQLKKMRLTNCVAKEVDFGEADLTGAVFSLTDLAGSTFFHTDLTDADFTSASNYTISAKVNTLKRTKFDLPEAISLLYNLDIILVDPLEVERPR